MKQIISPLLQIGICAAGYLYTTSNATLAQVTSDGTVNTQVNQNGSIAEITGGETRGSNLFHSFQDFSVPTGNEAFFNNANDISKILSRVTGGNISNIDGLIRANGSASLFLINPAGIIFGEGARLDIGGSFYGSTASSILFEDGEFSAADLENPPLLTINAPIGLNFRDSPAPIGVNGSNLAVPSGENLILLGGELNLIDGVRMFTPGANVELGAVAGGVTIGFDENLKLNFPDDITLANVLLSRDAAVNVISDDGGSITINARNFELLENSRLAAGIGDNAGFPDAQAGDIVINATENITLDGNSFILNQLGSSGQGNAGEVALQTSSLTLNNSSSIGGLTAGRGNSGNITINAEDTIAINSGSSLRSLVEAKGKGNAGDIIINTGVLNVETVEDTSETRSLIFANTRGVGNTGSIIINAADSITFDNSLLLAQVQESANGNGGNVSINTPYLEVRNSSSKIPIGVGIFTNTDGMGNAGSINISTDNALVIDRRSSISSGTTNEGNAGDINVITDLLSLSNFALISANTRMDADGSAGKIIVNANDVDILEGAIIAAFTSTDLTGGEININAKTLDMISGGNILTGSDGSGSAGNINLTISSEITVDGSNPAILPPEFVPFEDPILNALNGVTGVFASTTAQATGNGGNINILSPNASIVVSNDAQISVSSQGQGSGGKIDVEAQELTLDNNTSISASTSSAQGGSISLAVDNSITLRNDSQITARAFNDANGGNIDIVTDFVIAFPSKPDGSDIIASAEGGDGGNINITVDGIFNIQSREQNPLSNDINASSEVDGLDGSVTITTPDINPFQGTTELSTSVVEPEQTIAQACQANRETAAQNSFTIKGKGGILPTPEQPLNSLNVFVNSQANPTSTILEPIETSQGKIQPAIGIKVTESGKIILTAYRTNNAGERIPEGSRNCDQV